MIICQSFRRNQSFILNKLFACFALLLLLSQSIYAQTKDRSSKTINGTIVDAKSGEQIIGAQIATESGTSRAETNAYGYFSMNIPSENELLFVSYPGYEEEVLPLDAQPELQLGTIKLNKAASNELKAVVVSAQREKLREHVKSTQMGKTDLPVELLKKVPAIAGEPDIIKALQLTPGVKRGGEGTVGMYVRGGNVDENLILLDEATIYNAGHLLGFFSVFNASALKDVQLYKSAFPARYGGRLSSIMDVNMKNGNMKSFHGEGSLGLISSSLTIEGPIVKDKASFIISGRRSYLDFVTGLVGYKIPYYFYDLNAKVNYKIDDRNRIYLSGYKGDDVLRFSSEEEGDNIKTAMFLGNEAGSLRWNHLFKNPKLFSNVSLIYTQFRYNIQGKFDNNSLQLNSQIRDLGIKADLNYNINEQHNLHFGGNITNHLFRPNIINTSGIIEDLVKSKAGPRLNTYEQSLYINDDFKINSKWQLNTGLRLSMTAVSDKFYAKPEPRIATRYLINDQNSIKFSYARMAQYMHLVSSSSVSMPTDLWYPVSKNVKPGISDQLSLGYYYALADKGIAISIEGYYKMLQNQIEYREGASLLLNDKYEEELVKGKGNAYGFEFFLTKTSGKLSGWLGYTLSFAKRQFDDLNFGKPYYARFDRRHDIAFVGAYDLTRRHRFALNWVYSSGSPFTPQIGQYAAPSPSHSKIDLIPIYGERHSARLSAANRIDFDYTYSFRFFKGLQSEFHISVYNVLNRAQPGRVVRKLNSETGNYEYKERGLFGAIPTLSINFKF